LVDLEIKNNARLSLQKEKIKAQCELRLREAGLEPLERISGEGKEYLFVFFQILENTFSIDLQFKRDGVFHGADGTYFMSATTWGEGAFGRHNHKEAFLMNSLDGLLASFLNEYLKANAKEDERTYDPVGHQ